MGSTLQILNIGLNDNSLQGGEFRRITPMVNWYLSKVLRLEFTNGYGVLNRFWDNRQHDFLSVQIANDISVDI